MRRHTRTLSYSHRDFLRAGVIITRALPTRPVVATCSPPQTPQPVTAPVKPAAAASAPASQPATAATINDDLAFIQP